MLGRELAHFIQHRLGLLGHMFILLTRPKQKKKQNAQKYFCPELAESLLPFNS